MAVGLEGYYFGSVDRYTMPTLGHAVLDVSKLSGNGSPGAVGHAPYATDYTLSERLALNQGHVLLVHGYLVLG